MNLQRDKPEWTPETGKAAKQFFRDKAMEIDWHFMVTLNYHDHYFPSRTFETLETFISHVRSGLCRRSLRNLLFVDDAFYFFAFKEFDKEGHPHWHLIVRLDKRLHDRFEKAVHRRWNCLVNSGTSYVRRFGSGPEDRGRAVDYVTKDVSDARCFESFRCSADTRLLEKKSSTGGLRQRSKTVDYPHSSKLIDRLSATSLAALDQFKNPSFRDASKAPEETFQSSAMNDEQCHDELHEFFYI